MQRVASPHPASQEVVGTVVLKPHIPGVEQIHDSCKKGWPLQDSTEDGPWRAWMVLVCGLVVVPC